MSPSESLRTNFAVKSYNFIVLTDCATAKQNMGKKLAEFRKSWKCWLFQFFYVTSIFVLSNSIENTHP